MNIKSALSLSLLSLAVPLAGCGEQPYSIGVSSNLLSQNTPGPGITIGDPSSPTETPTGTSSSNATILVLDGSGSKALTMTGNASLTVGSGSIVVNSSAADALDLTGNVQIKASAIDLTGGYQATSGVAVPAGIRTGVKPTADPLASLATPATTGMKVIAGAQVNAQSGIHLKPGHYTSSVSISGGADVVLDPGTYVLDAGIKVSGGSTVTADGVLLYIAGGDVDFSGDSSGSLSPASSGPYSGITIFQARSNSAQSSLSGNTSWKLQGTYYFPAGEVTLTGGSSVAQQLQLIVYDLTLTGNAAGI